MALTVLAFAAIFVIVWSSRDISNAISDEPSETYQCLVDTYLTDHHNIDPDISDNYSINYTNNGALWLHVDNQPILQTDDTLFAEGISRC